MPISAELLDAYRWHRQSGKNTGRNAREALLSARCDVHDGKRRYPSSGASGAQNAEYEIGRTKLRWIENPSAIGLRFVGYADKLSRHIDHTGWFTDSDFQDGKIRGVVFQFPARKGRAQYVAGHDNEDNGAADCNGPCALALRDIVQGEDDDEARREAARDADYVAERAAESEREYNDAWQAGQRYAYLGADCTGARREILDLCLEYRAARDLDGAKGLKTICATIKARVESLLDDMRDMRRQRAELRDNFTGRSWRGADSLESAFWEGAGK